MRLLGHPVHVMLVHFPIALWPAHWGFHLLAKRLPEGLAGVAGFWLLVVGTAAGWLAAGAGFMDLAALHRSEETFARGGAWRHGAVNGSVLLGFTVLLGLELPRYPDIVHDTRFIVMEWVLLVLLGVGNYLGGTLVWTKSGAGPN